LIRLTARGAVVLALAVFTLGVLLAGWLGQPAVAGVFFVAGGAAAVWWVRKADLPLVAVSPATLLCIVVLVVSAVTGSGGLAVAVAEGAALTLAGAAPWLFAGIALSLIIAAGRSLREGAGGYPRLRSRGSAKAIRSGTASTSRTSPKPNAARRSSTPVTSSSGTDAPLVSPTVVAPASQAGSSDPASSTR
jgi:uncharacterized protein DUF6542